MEENARKISELGRNLYEAVRTLGASTSTRSARGSSRSLEAYNDAVGSLEGNVLVEGAQVQGAAGGQRRRRDQAARADRSRPADAAGAGADRRSAIPRCRRRQSKKSERSLTIIPSTSSSSAIPKGDGKAGYYVGMTGLSPEQRFENHKNGIKAARIVRRCGERLVPRLYAAPQPDAVREGQGDGSRCWPTACASAASSSTAATDAVPCGAVDRAARASALRRGVRLPAVACRAPRARSARPRQQLAPSSEAGSRTDAGRLRPPSEGPPLHHPRRGRRHGSRHRAAMGIEAGGGALRRARTGVDRTRAATACRWTTLADSTDRHAADAAALRARATRTAGAAARTRRAPRPDGFAREHPQSAMAMGIVLAERPHLSELAPGRDAAVRSRLRDDPRADAPEADGSLAAVLEAGRGGVSRLSSRARVAQDLSPRLNTRRTSRPNSGSSRRPRM